MGEERKEMVVVCPAGGEIIKIINSKLKSQKQKP